MRHSKIIYLKPQTLRRKLNGILNAFSVESKVKRYLVDGLLHASMRGVDSHGIRLFPHYVMALENGRINGHPRYKFEMKLPAAGLMDADHTFGHAAGAEAMLKAVSLARKNGVGVIAVKNSSHFGAAAYYSLMAAAQDMIGISMTHADALMLTYNAKKPYFGTNPISIAVPCSGEDPFCLDMATTIFTWNKIKQYKSWGRKLPSDIGADCNGFPTSDLEKVACLLPIGKYKGFGLSMAIEIFCSMLTGMPFGTHISSMYKAPINEKRFLGHFFLAINISAFENVGKFKKRMKQMMEEVRTQPGTSKKSAVMVPGDPEKKCFAQRRLRGIPVENEDIEALKKLEQEI